MQATWREILSYETDAMSRDEILAASYDAAAALNELKFRHGLIGAETYREVMKHQDATRQTMEAMERAFALPDRERQEALLQISGKIRQANANSLFSKNELDWHSEANLRASGALVLSLMKGLAWEVACSAHRLLGSYDTAVFGGKRMPAFMETPGAHGNRHSEFMN